jgi:hypothetical protein
MSDIHSCSYYCTRPACVLAQRDELRDRFLQRGRRVDKALTNAEPQVDKEQAEPVAISDFGVMVIGWHALLNCDCENDQQDDAIEALVMALHRGNKRQYGQQAEPVAWPKKREPRAAEITESDSAYARSEGYEEGWNDCLAACMKQQAEPGDNT